MIKQVVHPYNLQRALRQVIVNKGSTGIDKMKVTELTDYFREHKSTIVQAIQVGNYQVQAILGVEIPKSNGKTRLLGVPTVVDRLLQQAMSQVLMSKWENDFSANSSMVFVQIKMHDKP
jgi:retron-type reverse transcriptase